MENVLLERELQKIPRPFVKPTGDPKELDKRGKLELCKPFLRDHGADQDEPFYRESYQLSFEEKKTPFYENYEKRWSFIYGILHPQYGTDLLGQARGEIQREDALGHYRVRAYGSVELIEDGTYKWEVSVTYPIPYLLARTGGRWGWDEKKLYSERRKFRWRRSADRWLRGRYNDYERYIDRLLAEGVYDDYVFEK